MKKKTKTRGQKRDLKVIAEKAMLAAVSKASATTTTGEIADANAKATTSMEVSS
eukprot:CAMPEP_0183402462 /NCGR_PEP_ID=MMETSP0370-20130417/13921_1 /TAXON_ID=268820 /ORGANISM="Peridinium aciculiferum, Strain PAER-2" /LENGTH=53 /DNA_ID=CAMNT_0025584053 /DNA_START=117 /DNA_END=278 /DNA_ORIENTATION=-